jgi:hypothetical protein
MVVWERRASPVLTGAGTLLLVTTGAVALATGGLSQRSSLLIGAGLALVALPVLLDPLGITGLAWRPRALRGSLAAIAAGAVVGVLVAANVVVSGGSRGVDLTRSRLHTLSPRSVAVTRHLTSDLVATGFFRPAETQARRGVQDLLDLYRQQNPRVRVRFVDPDQDPALAIGIGATATGSLVLQYRTQPPIVLNRAEQSEPGVTGAIVRLQSSPTPVVCWASGEGERDLRDANGVSGYTSVAALLRTSGYHVQDVAVAAQGIAPACDVLVLVQLTRPLEGQAVTAMATYLARGGKLLLAVDPWVEPDLLASANAVLRPYGAAFDGGLVVEPDPAHAAAGDPTVPVVTELNGSPVTRDLARGYAFFPQATPITGAAPAGVASSPMATTTAAAFAIPRVRTSLDRRAGDRPGPFVLMRSLEVRRPVSTTRIILAGTSSLAENRAMPPAAAGDNADLLLASLDWLTQRDPLGAVAPKPPDAGPPPLGAPGRRVDEVLTVAVLPLLVAAIRIGIEVRRRRRT